MRCSRWRTTTVGLTGMVVIALLAPSAQATAAASHEGFTTTQTLSYRGGTCQLKSDLPHWTPRAGSVIFKTRVECVGTEAPTVRITGTMNYTLGGLPGAPSQGELHTVATSVQEQVVPIGKTVTYYTPLPNAEKLVAPGTYQGVATGEVVAPQHSNLTTYTTPRTYALPPVS